MEIRSLCNDIFHSPESVWTESVFDLHSRSLASYSHHYLLALQESERMLMMMMMMMKRKGSRESLALVALLVASASCILPPTKEDLNRKFAGCGKKGLKGQFTQKD